MIDYSDNPAAQPIQNRTECGYEINQDYDFYEYNGKDEIICDGCYESHWESAVMVYEFDPNEESVRRLDYAFNLDKTRDVDNYDTYEGTPICIKSAGWKSTDGWRGFIDVKFADGYNSIASGWSTDRYDDVKWKWNFNDFVEQIIKGTLVPPTSVWFVFAQTSNIFSTAADIVLQKKDEKKFLKWLAQETGMTRLQLQDALK